MLSKLKLTQICIAMLCPLLFSITSCKKASTHDEIETKQNVSQTKSIKPQRSGKEQNLLIEEFAALLSLIVQQDKEVRIFLKEEALKQFDLDYDILYHLVKDKKISGGASLHERLGKYAKNEDQLLQIERELPLLTIFIPELPGDFSAEKWKAETEVPAVSTGLIKNETVSFLMPDGTNFQMKSDLYPGFPTLVIKDNERVQLARSTENSTRATIAPPELKTKTYSYEFLSDKFNGLQNGNVTTNSTCFNCYPDSKVVNAWAIWEDYKNDQLWQRDYIYYTISPSSVNGPLDQAFQEHLTSIKFKTGLEAYNKITDQGDPRGIDGYKPKWTEGSYEFSLTVLINNTVGLGTSITKLFPVPGPALFDITYTQIVSLPPIYKINTITPKEYKLNQVIAAWDIRTNGIGWKVLFAEVDPSQTYTQQHTVSSQFAGNFGLDLIKKGLKFGLSGSTTSSTSYTLVTQLDDDQVGEAAMYFYDPVITFGDIIPPGPNGGPTYTFKDTDTGWALLNIQPKRVF